MEGDFSFKEDKSAMFNSGISKLFRIGKLKETCHDSRIYKDHDKWFGCLQGIRSEMNSKLTKEDTKKGVKSERKECDTYEKVIKMYLNREFTKRVDVLGKKVLIKDIDIFDVLYGYELYLGDLEEKYKFGMPDMDSAWSALK